MNNQPVPMDMSNWACIPNWCNRQTQGNAAQVKLNQRMNWPPCKCFNCNKVSHLAAQGCAPKKAQINYIINKPEEIMNLSAPLTPDGILDDALSNFN